MRILVTGAAGFIGSHLSEALVERGDQVVGIDNFDPFYHSDIKHRNLEGLRSTEGFEFVEADIREPAQVQSVWANHGPYDAVVHLAAKAGVRPSIEDPVGYQRTNILGTTHLLQQMAEQVTPPKMVFASSSSVYGNNPTVPFSEMDPVDHPISPYAQTKKAGELLCHTYHHLHRIPVVALRFFTVFGPRQRPDLAIHKFTARILSGETIDQYGDGSTSRDYTFISDIVQGILASIDRCESFEVVNLGSDTPVTLLEMISAIEAACGVKAKVRRMPSQPGDVDRTWANVSKARELLEYRPTTSFAAGVSAFVEWYRSVQERNEPQ